MDLADGHYEAGNRLKITFASAYFVSRTAWTCLYQSKLYTQLEFEVRLWPLLCVALAMRPVCGGASCTLSLP